MVGLLTFRIGVFEALSLKDKRRVTKSLKDRVAARHNVSIAEVDDLDARQLATFEVAMVSNDRKYVEGALSKILDEVRRDGRAALLSSSIEMI